MSGSDEPMPDGALTELVDLLSGDAEEAEEMLRAFGLDDEADRLVDVNQDDEGPVGGD